MCIQCTQDKIKSCKHNDYTYLGLGEDPSKFASWCKKKPLETKCKHEVEFDTCNYRADSGCDTYEKKSWWQ